MKHDVISVPETAASIVSLPGIIPPAPAVMAILDRFSREQLGHTIEVLISLLDIWDGDPDREANGDELDGTGGEDDFCEHSASWPGGPGCPVSDPDCAVDDIACDEPDQDREPEEGLHCDYGENQSKGPLPQQLGNDRAILRPHIERVRREVCRRIEGPDLMGRTHALTEFAKRPLN